MNPRAEPETIATGASEDADQIHLLELLVVIAENLKLLIFGPLLVGLAALGIAYWWQPTYESVSVIQTDKVNPQLVASLARSADVLEAVAQELGLETQSRGSERLQEMQKRISTAVGRQDNLVTITARAATAQQAQALNKAILARVYPLTRPTPADVARLHAQLKVFEEGLSASTALEQTTARQLQSGQVSEGVARLYGEIQAIKAQRVRDIAALQAQLEGLTDANLIQQPVLPDRPAKPKKALIAVLASLATGMLLLVLVFAREGFRRACNNPAQASTLSQLRAALGLKP